MKSLYCCVLSLQARIHKFRLSNWHRLRHQLHQPNHRRYCQRCFRTDLESPWHRTEIEFFISLFYITSLWFDRLNCLLDLDSKPVALWCCRQSSFRIEYVDTAWKSEIGNFFIWKIKILHFGPDQSKDWVWHSDTHLKKKQIIKKPVTHLFTTPQEETIAELHNISLVHASHLLPLIFGGIIERKLGNASGFFCSYNFQALHHSGNRFMFQCRIFSFRLFTDDNTIDVMMTTLDTRQTSNMHNVCI